MFRKVLETIGTRYIVALLNLALIFINARVLGLQGVGLVGLILASVNIAVIFNSVLCGNTIVYFMNKYPVNFVLLPAYLWTPVGSALACLLMYVFGFIPEGYGIDIFWLAILNSFVAANARFLLGKDKVKSFNLTFFLQGGLLFFLLIYFYYLLEEKNIQAYLWGMYLANGVAFVISGLLLIPHLTKETSSCEKSFLSIIREMFAYGLWSSADNLAETYTTRLNYFLVRNFSGLGAVGILDAGTKISESVWHISRSVSFITYSEVSRQSAAEIRKKITLRLLKFTLLAVTSITLLIALIPEWIYTQYLFTPEFSGMRKVILILSPGIICFSGYSILSHYFIGSGKVKLSAACSFTGLIILLIIGLITIPAYGVIGSAITSSLSFSAMFGLAMILFTRETSTTFREFLPGKDDFIFIQNKIRQRFSFLKKRS